MNEDIEVSFYSISYWSDEELATCVTAKVITQVWNVRIPIIQSVGD